MGKRSTARGSGARDPHLDAEARADPEPTPARWKKLPAAQQPQPRRPRLRFLDEDTTVTEEVRLLGMLTVPPAAVGRLAPWWVLEALTVVGLGGDEDTRPTAGSENEAQPAAGSTVNAAGRGMSGRRLRSTGSPLIDACTRRTVHRTTRDEVHSLATVTWMLYLENSTIGRWDVRAGCGGSEDAESHCWHRILHGWQSGLEPGR